MYDSNGMLYAFKYNGDVFYYARDALGNINPFRYKGYYYDIETGLFWLSSRYYSPKLCRFIQSVDVSSLNPHSINGLSLYFYANNNPIRSTVLNPYNFNTTSNYVYIIRHFKEEDL